MMLFTGQDLKEKALLKLSHLEFGALELTLPAGDTHYFKGRQSGPKSDLQLKSPKALSPAVIRW